MKITNELNLPQAVVNAVTPKCPHNKEGCISATTLIRGPKEIILGKRHWSDMVSDASNKLYAALGTAVHLVFENEDDKSGVLREQELSKKVGDYTITGKMDRFDPEEKTIYDYKMTSVYKIKAGNYEEWYTQLMIYAWLLRDAGYEVEKLRIVAILRDWSRTDAKRDSSYPQTQSVIIPFDIKEDDFKFIEGYINEKVKLVAEAEKLDDDAIPPCTAKERWEKPPKFAVTKPNATRAIKLFDDEAAAQEHLEKLKADPKTKDKDKLVIEHRLGTSTKCADYCDCCQFCNFYKENIADE